MLTRQAHLMIEALLQAIVFLLGGIEYYEKARNKIMWQDQMKQSTRQ